jgi:ADP-ribose pyrophosphatase YjhB (NUDIX family)
VIPDVTRPCAFVFIREGDRMLVGRMLDPSNGTSFLRPLGGGIAFGELAVDAARREIREELGREIRDVRLLGVIEDVFSYDGRDGHEIAFVLEAEPDGWSIDAVDGDAIPGSANHGSDETAVVIRAADVDHALLYPAGVAPLVRGPRSSQAATAAVIRDGRILLARRRDDGFWEMPGGGVEDGESPWAAAVRECREECLVEVRADHLVGVYQRPERGFTMTVVACTWIAGDPTPSDEVSEAGWFAPGSLPPPIEPVVRQRIADALAGATGTMRTQRG